MWKPTPSLEHLKTLWQTVVSKSSGAVSNANTAGLQLLISECQRKTGCPLCGMHSRKQYIRHPTFADCQHQLLAEWDYLRNDAQGHSPRQRKTEEQQADMVDMLQMPCRAKHTAGLQHHFLELHPINRMDARTVLAWQHASATLFRACISVLLQSGIMSKIRSSPVITLLAQHM